MLSVHLFNIPFRSDYNGRPQLVFHPDDEKYMIIHPGYCYDSTTGHYGRVYSFYRLDENWKVDPTFEAHMYCTISDVIRTFDLKAKLFNALDSGEYNVDLCGDVLNIESQHTGFSTLKFLEGMLVASLAPEFYGCIKRNGRFYVLKTHKESFMLDNEEAFELQPRGLDLSIFPEGYEEFKKGYCNPFFVHQDVDDPKPGGNIYGLPKKGVLVVVQS